MSLAFDPTGHRNAHNTPWTHKSKQRLMELWPTNSSETIAVKLLEEFNHPFSRKSVMRRAQRMGLPPRKLSVWNDERLARLRLLWADFSGLQIAQKMTSEYGVTFTRNSIIAMVQRLALTSDGKSKGGRPRETDPAKLAERRAKTAATARAYAEKQKLRRVAPQIEDFAIPTPQRKTLMELGAHDCRWPVGDPKKDLFFFCGAVAEENKPYCSSHCARAYVEIRPR